MLKSMTFRSTLAAVACAISLSAHAMADTPKAIDVPAGDLIAALESLAKQAAVELVYQPEQLRSFRTKGVRGTYEPKDAVRVLLKGMPLELRTDPSGAMVIAPARAELAPETSSADGNNGAEDAKEVKKSPSDSFRLAQVDQSTNSRSSAVGSNASASEDTSLRVQLEEVVVTAQKREEHLQDVPVAVTAISARALVEQNQLRFEDYFSNIPGLNYASGDRGEIFPSIRGLTTGTYTTPTVGIVIDDVPYGASAAQVPAPDIDPSDLERVEVLRGPQGTLYGSSSLGGLINYVTIAPSTEALSGRVEVGTSSVYNGAGLGYSTRGSVNIPLSDTLAVRASGFTREDPAYIDNPVRGTDNINDVHAYGGRIAALWSPSDKFSLKLGAMVQHSDATGSSEAFVKPGFGDLQQNFLLGTGGYERDDEIFNATLKAKLGSVDLTSISGYSYYKHKSTLDLSSVFGSIFQPLFGVNGAAYSEDIPVKKFSQEIRFSGPLGEHVEWLAGAYYTHENYSGSFSFPAINPLNGSLVGDWGGGAGVNLYSEYALFADVTFHITDRIDVQVGGRESHDEQPSADVVYTGGYASTVYGSNPYPVKASAETENPFTYLLTPEFKIAPNLMTYFRLASGFRPGGPNTAIAASEGASPVYGPDKTQNYEVGIKGDVLDRVLSFDMSLYRINWTNVQVSLETPVGQNYYANAGGAKSQGIELSTQLRPLKSLTIGAWVTWDDAVLTKSFPTSTVAQGLPGERLPYGARFSSNLSVDERFPIANGWSGFAGGMLSYMGEREGDFTSATTQRQIFPGYAKLDTRAGIRYGSWTVNVFVNNVANRRGVLGGGIDGFPAYAFIYTTPRTIGLSVSKTFNPTVPTR
jgi:iron complex outermembrane receptor protein